MSLLTEAMNDAERSNTKNYFGQVHLVDAAAYVLKKGQGKKLFDPGIHDPQDKRIEVTFGVTPLDANYTVERSYMSFDKGFTKITAPSLKRLGIADENALVGRWVQIAIKSSGETYTNSSGEVKDRTAMEFVTLFDSEAACRAAADAFFNRDSSDSSDRDDRLDEPQGATFTPQPEPTPAPAAPVVPSPERAAMVPMLELVWKAVQGDPLELEKQLQANQMLKVFTMDSPEVLALTGVAF